jgi:hypothetical protein
VPEGKYVWDFDINLFGEMVGNIQWGADYIIDDAKVYRNNVLIYSGSIRAFNNTNGIHLRRNNPGDSGNAGDFEVGDVITTQLQEDSVNHFNMTPKDGWYVSGIETNKQEGNIHEFIEKEGKWFNYIKGVDSDITSDTDFGAFDIQGIGMLNNLAELGGDSLKLVFVDDINTSLQVGDTIYFQQPSATGSFVVVDPGAIVLLGTVISLEANSMIVNTSNSPHLIDLLAFGYFIGTFTDQHYIMFAKNHTLNTSSLVGYFADVKFENNSTEKIELFSVGSEITESSK